MQKGSWKPESFLNLVCVCRWVQHVSFPSLRYPCLWHVLEDLDFLSRTSEPSGLLYQVERPQW
jgi:hypothetical protein